VKPSVVRSGSVEARSACRIPDCVLIRQRLPTLTCSVFDEPLNGRLGGGRIAPIATGPQIISAFADPEHGASRPRRGGMFQDRCKSRPNTSSPDWACFLRPPTASFSPPPRGYARVGVPDKARLTLEPADRADTSSIPRCAGLGSGRLRSPAIPFAIGNSSLWRLPRPERCARSLAGCSASFEKPSRERPLQHAASPVLRAQEPPARWRGPDPERRHRSPKPLARAIASATRRSCRPPSTLVDRLGLLPAAPGRGGYAAADPPPARGRARSRFAPSFRPPTNRTGLPAFWPSFVATGSPGIEDRPRPYGPGARPASG